MALSLQTLPCKKENDDELLDVRVPVFRHTHAGH